MKSHLLPIILFALMGLAVVPPLSGEERPRILGISHMAVKVSDIERSVPFYRDLLGFTEQCRLNNLKDGSLMLVCFKVSDEQSIEVFTGLKPGEERLYQLAYCVDDAEVMRAYLAKNGVKVPANVSRGQMKNLGFTVQDPSGYTIEFVQYTPDGWTRRDQGKFLPDTRVSEHITHGGVAVRDLAPMMHFYGDILGFTESWRGGASDNVLSWINMKVPGSSDYVEFMLDPKVAPHFCLLVPDVEKAKAKLESSPYRSQYNKPLEVRVGKNRKRQLNLYDPDGTRVELMEPNTVEGVPAPSSQVASAVLSPRAAAEQVNMAERAEELKSLHWGMFICWSFSTFSGKEWTPGVTDVSFFKATGCDTDQWARTAKEAGMGYILFLTKHHDGFCLWDTRTTDRQVTKSPLGRDVLAELRQSCAKYGIRLALYFSEGDWTWPGAVDGKGWQAGVGKNPDMKKAQLKELLTRYGPVEYIWFDHAVGDGGLSHAETIVFCKSLQPGCFIGFNHGEQQGADIRLGELGRPGSLNYHAAAGPYMKDPPSQDYRLAEFTYPILPPHEGGAMWFYSLPKHEALCHPAEKLYHDYLGAVEFGNIFSLDVGPDYAGRLREVDVQTLRRVGEMIRRHAP